jgi:hypothetical protein
MNSKSKANHDIVLAALTAGLHGIHEIAAWTRKKGRPLTPGQVRGYLSLLSTRKRPEITRPTKITKATKAGSVALAVADVVVVRDLTRKLGVQVIHGLVDVLRPRA